VEKGAKKKKISFGRIPTGKPPNAFEETTTHLWVTDPATRKITLKGKGREEQKKLCTNSFWTMSFRQTKKKNHKKMSVEGREEKLDSTPIH